ncbi:hypothetical protein MalM25_25540 [Planctomycetes bacterium MalM25]|nr:hypothetical protein MalM25_25540 [Planctomycetes bacterium MalM25]
MGPLFTCRSAPLLSLAVAAASWLLAPPALGRVWTNTEGQTLEAEFVRLRGRDALLKTEERTITAPINRLAQEDQDWIERYRELTRSREWGKPGAEPVRGQFFGAKNGKVRLKHGSKVLMLPYDQIGEEDWRQVEQALKHLEQEIPEDLLTFKPAAPAPSERVDLDAAIERTWTDAKGREIVAKYLGVSGPKVRLWMRDKEFVVPLARFSDADRSWVARQNLASLTGSFQKAMSAAGQVAMRAQMNAAGPPPGAFGPASGGPPRPQARPDAPRPEWQEGGYEVPPGAPPRPQPRREVDPSKPPTSPPPATPVEAIAVAPTTDTPPTPLADAVVESPAPTTPRIQHFDELSDEEYDALLDKAFASYPPIDYDDPYAEVYCDHCEGEYVTPEGYTYGDPCPLCGLALNRDELYIYSVEDEAYSRPWYLQRWARRIIITLVIAGIGTAVKLGMGGE